MTWVTPQARSCHGTGPGPAGPPQDAAGQAAAGEAPPGEALRAVMRHHAKGVAIVTTGTDVPVGFCATSLASVSLDPPLVSFTVGLRSSSWVSVESARHVVVHLLADGQEDLARRFAQQDVPRFGPGTGWHRGAHGLPVLDGVLAWMLVALISHLPAGDHALVIGRVAGTAQRAGAPLIHHNGGFARLAATPPPGPAAC